MFLPKISIALDGDLLWYAETEIESPKIFLTDENGGAFVVWKAGGDPVQIRAQRYDYDGNPLWGAEGVLVSDAINADYPAATEDNNAGLIVAWAASNNIYAQRLNKNGLKQWNSGTGVLVYNNPIANEKPVICSDGFGGAYIGLKTRIAQVNENGNVPLVNGIQLTTSSAERYSLIADGEQVILPPIRGGAFAAWVDKTSLEIRAQHINPGLAWGDDGKLVSTRFTYITNPYDRDVRLVKDGVGGVIVAWRGWEGYPTGSGQIRAQRLDSDGNPLWGSDGVTVLNTNDVGGDIVAWYNQFEPPEIITDGNQGAILVWKDMRNTDINVGDTDIYCQRINSTGNPEWKTNGIWILPAGDDITASGAEAFPAIASDNAGGAIVVFADAYQSWNLYANRLDSDGKTIWSRNIIFDDFSSGDFADQTEPKIIFDSTGPSPKGAIIAWFESVGSSYDDRAQKVEISSQTPPENDDSANAIPLYLNCQSNSCTFGGSLYWATNDGSASCGSAGQKDVWFKFEAPSSGKFSVYTCGTNDMFGVDSGLDTVLSFHTGIPGNQANQIDCNDDWPRPSGACLGKDTGLISDSFLTRDMISGEQVYIRLARYSELTNGLYLLGSNFECNLSEGDFDGDGDTDGSDLAKFAADFGRTDCIGDCEGNFDGDNDVDDSDLAVFAAGFGRTDSP
jgi:hypothetical protein